MILLEPHNLPFAASLIALFIIAALQIIGVGDLFEGADDIEIEIDADVADGLEASGFLDGVSSVLGLGRVPFLVWLSSLLFVFTVTGVFGQWIISSLAGSPLSAGLAGLLAGGASLPLNGLAVRPIEKVLPKDETTAVGLESLVRRDAVIQTGTAREASPARAKVKDAFGHPHFVMVEPHDPQAELTEGETVLLVRREGEIFFGVRYESPLLQP
ncbi:OB-fold-containig protein [Erythrobacter sp. F6033]|uniref:OB-fold-containig protein n=1 Tax=Erythrobacter sp. F6033 TaxID=2926401 RepID=UPI001FF3404D|nr:OB-fold-containig protein [Erythrobacter sp. F6033]MCK0129617.1 YqiJ family protein [Erythrobacter sp. F6033]